MLRALSHSLAPAACLGILTLAACGGGDRAETGDVGTPGDTAVTAGEVRPSDTTAATPQLTDANIVALLDEANMADSAGGAVAAPKATAPEVKAFARLMMSEHHALRQQGQQLAKQLGVTPEPPSTDPLKPLAESEMTALKATAKGADFDRVYIEHEIEMHKAVLDLADDAHGAAKNEQLKALIEKAKPVIQKHLDQAEEIQGKLGKATT